LKKRGLKSSPDWSGYAAEAVAFVIGAAFERKAGRKFMYCLLFRFKKKYTCQQLL